MGGTVAADASQLVNIQVFLVMGIDVVNGWNGRGNYSSNIVVAIVGAITLALRFYLKKRFNIKSATMGPTR